MIQVLVVDDEPLICEWLVMCLKACNIENLNISQASNGEEAWNLLESKTFDILFTDITMPHLDGMDLIERIRKKNSDIKIVILTCHDDFNLARKAIKFEVFEYLIKNELNQEVIIALMNKIVDQSNDEKIKDELFLQKMIWADTNTIEELEEIFNLQKIPLINSAYFVLAFQNSSINSRLQKMLHMSFKKSTQFYDGIHLIVFVANFNDNNKSYTQQIEIAKKIVISNLGEVTNIGISQYHDNLMELRKGIDIAIEEWEKLFFGFTEGTSIDCYDLNSTLSSGRKEVKNKILEQKDLIISDFKKSAYIPTKNQILDLCDFFYKNKILDSYLLKKTVLDIIESTEDSSSSKITFSNHMATLFGANNIYEIKQYIETYFNNVAEYNSSNPIAKARQYIIINYGKQITLSELASQAYLSEEYFSRLFKKETGKTVTEYITEVRMNRAKKLLQQSNLNISEISDVVGINNASYFSIQFKKFFGVSPTSYRQ